MPKKYAFKCTCGYSLPTMDFVADNFVHRDYLNLLPDCWWSIEADGSVQFECDGHRWPEELSKRFFMNAARKYAKKILSGEEKMWCEECGSDLLIIRK